MTSPFESQILPLYEEHRADWLAYARRKAVELGKDGRTVTIDDVRAVAPPPLFLDPRVCGAVFIRSEWEKVGYLNSGRAICHGRPVAVFRRRDCA
ncbi:hypothetical protein [Methylobacterium oryzisoli]|uniref:hypothetical protein n=1 Tax=Methylobacterium oryzisoli TaxID=3385502 RepID=UPI003891ACBC